MAGRLPRVTEYIKNLGKSVAYASVEVVKEPTENITDFIDTNEDLFKVIYSATKNYRETLKTVDRSIKSSKIYDAANSGFKALKEDLKSGNFYNKEREDKFAMSAFGDDFADFGEFDDDNLGMDFDSSNEDEDFDDSDTKSAKAIIASSAGLGEVINETSKSQSSVIISSAEAIADVNKASTRLLSSQNEKINASIVSGFAGVNAGINMVASILNGPMVSFMNESTKFYSDISGKISETNAYLKEMTEMQRNLYKAQETAFKSNKYDEIVSASGMPDITAYAKQVYKNIINLDPTGGMLAGDKDENLFKAFVGSPLKAIPMMIAKMIIPTTVTKTLQAFDENMSGLFSAFIARMNTWAKGDNGAEGIDIKGILGSILGINMSSKTSVDTSKYIKGPIPFDGETKKAIVDVIPAYLARIESAISGMPERVFDGRTGKFKTVREVHKEYLDISNRGAMESLSSIQDDFDKWARKRVENYKVAGRDASNKEKDAYYKELKNKFKKVGQQIYRDGGDFRPYQGFGPKGERALEERIYSGGVGQFEDDEWLSLMRYLTANNKKGIYEISKNSIEAILRANRELEGAEGMFANPYTALFDGRLNILDKNGRLKAFKADSSEIEGEYKKNSRFKSATDYLKDILAEVRWIRMNGTKGKFKGTSGSSASSNITFEDYYKSNFGEETYEDPYEKEYEGHWIKAAEKQASKLEEYGVTKDFMQEMRDATTISQKWSLAKKSVDKLLKAPAKWAVDVINKADQRIFETMFGTPEGESFRDKHGLEYRGFLDYLVGRASEIFDDFKDKMKSAWQKFDEWFKKTKVGSWIHERGKQFVSDTRDALKRKFGVVKGYLKDSWDSTYGRIAESLRQGQLVDASMVQTMRRQREMGLDVHDAGTDDTRIDNYDEMTELLSGLTGEDIQSSALGRVATKYGLTMLSPGEIVIPNPGYKHQMRNLAGEKREKAKILQALKSGKISHHATGTRTTNKNESSAMAAVKKVMHEVGGEGGDIAADAIIGSGVSLITGLFGGPLLGAAAGAGVGLVKHSETIQKALFGEMGEDGKRKGGFFSKDFIEKITAFKNKNGKSMLNLGIAGGIAGLFTPLGLVGGILTGATLGYAKNTEWFQELMFGDEVKGKQGLMSNETKEKLKKAFPAMVLGGGAGILFGPFGLVGNALLGAGAGYVATSDKFKELVLGKEGEDGKKHGGLVGALKEGFIDPMSKIGKEIANDLKGFADKHIIQPTKEFIHGSGQFIRNIFLSIGDRVSDGINGIFEKHVGLPLNEWLREKVFKRVSSVIGTLLKPITWTAKKLVGLPFGVLGQVGATLKSGQIARGTMDTMTAQERLDYRNKHKVRFTRMGLMGRDKTKQLDTMLAGASEEDLANIYENIGTFVKNRGKANVAYNQLMDKTGSAVSDLFNENGIWASRGHAPLINAANDKKAIMNYIYKGDFGKARNRLMKAGLTLKEAEEFMSSIDTVGIANARNAMIQESGLDEKAIAQLESATGYTNLHRAGNRYVKQLGRLTKTELKSRQAANKAKTPEEEQAEAQQETADTSKKMLNVLISINNSLNGAGRILDENGSPVTSGEAKVQQNDPDSINRESQDNADYDEGELPSGDDKASVDARNRLKKRGKLQEIIASGISNISDRLHNMFGGEKEEKETPSLISRIFSSIGSAGKNVLSLLGSIGGSKVGLVAAGVGAAALVGYGSEFVKEKLMPALEKSELFNSIKNHISTFVGSIKDGSFFVNMAGKISQGLSYTLKNIAGPLTEAIIVALPGVVKGIASGVWSGIKTLFGGSKSTEKTAFSDSGSSDLSAGLAKASSSMPVGKDEAAIAAEFSGSSWSPSGSVNTPDYSTSGGTTSEAYNSVISNGRFANGLTYNGSNQYSSAGTYQNADGSTSVVDDNGNVTMYDSEGNKLGSYNQDTGEITSGGGITSEKSGVVARGVGNALLRGLATGKTPAVASAVGTLGRKLVSNKSILKSATNVVTGGSNPLGLVGRLASGVATSVKGAIRVGTEAVEKVGSIGSSLNKYITRNSSLAADAADAVLNAGGKVESAVSKTGTGIASKVGDLISGSAKDAVEKVTKNAASEIADGSIGIAEKIISFGKKLINSEVFTNILGFVSKFIKPIDQGILKNLFESLMEKIGKNITSKAGQKVASIGLKAIGGLSPLAIAGWATSFYNGCWGKTESILGVTKDSGLEITPAIRFVTGLVNALNDNLLLGLVPIDWIMDLVINTFGDTLGVSKDELEAAQVASDAILAQAGMDSGDTVSLEEYNGQQSLWTKVKNFFTGKETTTYKDYQNTSTSYTSGSTRTGTSYTSGSTRSGSGRGRGRGGQQGGIYSALKYGNSTIGESGCAPVAAASMIGSSIPEAAAFAQRTGHVASDGSTDIGYFNEYFSAKGIPNKTTTSKSAVSDALRNGGTAIMLGRDPGGGDESAYSNSSHYISARGDKNGNVVVNDPALGIRRMNKSKVLKNMKASVLTGRGRDPMTAVAKANKNANKIVQIALGEKGNKEGKNNNNKYGQAYGLNYQPWCCIFVWWVFNQAGASSLFYGGGKCASCTTLMNYYRNKGQVVSTAKAGDLIFFNFDKNPDRSKAKHIGICVKDCTDGNTVVTVEGNTSGGNSGSQDNGDGVHQRTRKMSQIVAIVRPAYSGATYDDAIPSDQYYNYETGTTSDSPTGTLFDKLAALGKLAVKAMFGEGLYNAVFGEDDSSTSTADDSGISTNVDPNIDESGELIGSSNAEKIWTYLRSKGYSKEGTAAIMGSLYNESGLSPNNLQNTYNKKLGMTDKEYTDAVNNGQYRNFSSDSAGYGLAQWTYSSRKKSLYDATISKGRPINNMKDQLDLLDKEVSDYGLSTALKGATSINEANKLFIHDFEKPSGSGDYGNAVYSTRLNTAQQYYNQFKGTGRGYANRVNNRFVNETGRARDDSSSTGVVATSTTSYNTFLQTIVSILLSIADNTEALSKILDILSKNFNINVSSSEVAESAKDTKKKAREALSTIMQDKADADELTNLLQTKDTGYLIDVMTSIARE